MAGGPSEPSVLGHLMALADEAADRPALLEAGRSCLSFGALVADLAAHGDRLRALGYGDGDRVAVLAPQGADTAVAVLATAGAATCIPLDPRLTAGECADTLHRTRAVAVLGPAGLDAVAWRTAERLGVAVLRWRPAGPEAGRIHIEGDPRLPTDGGGDGTGGLILRTSGTTSVPKLVRVDRRRMLARAMKASRLLGLTPEDRAWNPMPLCYASGIDPALLGSLAAGASVICPVAFERDAFLAALESLGPTWYTGSPTHHRAVVGWLREGRPPHHGLRFVRASSGPLDPTTQAALESLLGVPVLTAFGTSETGLVTANPVIGLHKGGTVGVTTDGDVTVVDDAGAAVSPGTLGEVVVEGPTVFNEYLGDAELPSGRFHTGDLGRLDEDGYLTLEARMKDMINRGGEKVAPAEVDLHVLAHPDVLAAATFPVPHPRLGEDVAVAVQFRPGATVTETELRRFLLGRLTSFKVPRRFVAVDALPLGPTGKPLRRVLTATYGTAPDAVDDDAVASPLVELLRALWATSLDLDHTGPDDDFFTMGGDSLAAVELLEGLETALGIRLSLNALIERSTPRRLADGLADPDWKGRHVDTTQDTVVVNAGGSAPPLFAVSGRFGHVLRLLPLARALGADQPVYTLQPPAMDWQAAGCRTIAEMAAHYAGRIRSIDPVGPYRLFGFSFGGLVMFEVAGELQAGGGRVELLMMVDTAAPAVGWIPGDAARVVDRLDDEPAVRGPVGTEGRRVAEAHWRARRDHVMRERFEGELVFVLSTGNAIVPGDDRRPWADAATLGTRLLVVPGRHAEIDAEPQLSTLRELLGECLAGRLPEGVDPTTTFDRSYHLDRDAVVRDDGVRIPIAGIASDGRVEVVRPGRRTLRIAGRLTPSGPGRPELVVFVRGQYAGRGTATAEAGFSFRFRLRPRRSVRVFALDGDTAVELGRR